MHGPADYGLLQNLFLKNYIAEECPDEARYGNLFMDAGRFSLFPKKELSRTTEQKNDSCNERNYV
jgi:hypothetical protein